MQDITIATRIFDDYDPVNGTAYEIVDRMVRKPDGSFYLIEGPGCSGEPEVVTTYSLQDVYDWLQDVPWQIRRTVIVNESHPAYEPS